MARAPLTVRMLLLLPLLSAGIDLTRATSACGAQAQTCLEVAGRGWLGPLAVLLVVAHAAGGGVLPARLARRGASGPGGAAPPSLWRLWARGTDRAGDRLLRPAVPFFDPTRFHHGCPGKVELDAQVLHFLGPGSVTAARAAAGARERDCLWRFLEAFFAQGQENSGYVTPGFARGGR